MRTAITWLGIVAVAALGCIFIIIIVITALTAKNYSGLAGPAAALSVLASIASAAVGALGGALAPTLRTQDTTPPTVSQVNPKPEATNVPATVEPSATFSKDVAPATVNPTTFRLASVATDDASNLTIIPGQVNYDAPSKTATFIPTVSATDTTKQPLAPGTKYQATITAGVQDQVGNALGQDYPWTFTTATPETTGTTPGQAAEALGAGTLPTEGRTSPRAEGETPPPAAGRPAT